MLFSTIHSRKLWINFDMNFITYDFTIVKVIVLYDVTVKITLCFH